MKNYSAYMSTLRLSVWRLRHFNNGEKLRPGDKNSHHLTFSGHREKNVYAIFILEPIIFTIDFCTSEMSRLRRRGVSVSKLLYIIVRYADSEIAKNIKVN